MQKRANNEVFDHFLEFGLLDRLNIAYCDSTKCLPTLGNITRSWKIIQNSQKCFFEWSKGPKKRFLAIFWSLVCLILHIVILLNVFQLLATLPGHEGSFKGRKNAFWMIQRARKTFLAIFWSLDCLIGMILHIVIVLDIFQHLATLPCHEGSF